MVKQSFDYYFQYSIRRMPWSLSNKVIVVTGGAEGIGFEITKEFLQKGAKKVIILDINETLGKKTSENLNAKFNRKVVFMKCDVTKDLDKTTDIILKEIKNVDVLVNNAGISEGVKKTVDINLTAVLEWSFKFYEHIVVLGVNMQCHLNMRKDKGGNGGTIINMASQAGYVDIPFTPIYNATKWAVLGFTKTLGHKFNYNKTGVRVVAICPGLTNTSLVKNSAGVLEEDWNEEFDETLKNSGWQEPDAVGRAAGAVYEKADSGTAWEIKNNEPIKQVFHNVTKQSGICD